MNNISPETKDKILNWMLSNLKYSRSGKYSRKELAVYFELDLDTLDAIFRYFERLNFINISVINSQIYMLNLQIEASDFMQRGGFVGQEFLLLQNLDKLLLEIKKLEPEFASKTQTITTIVANITQAISLFFPNKSVDNIL